MSGGAAPCVLSPSSIILVTMSKGRLEAFSDGVIAILITIMVLELRVPEGADWPALKGLAPIFLSYVLSFIFLGIYWNNHHHLFQASKQVNGSVLWANLHLLFWLSLISFVTGWMGENNFAQLPVALYGVVLWMSGLAYYILTLTLVTLHGTGSVIATALGRRIKEIGSLVAYTVAIVFAFINTNISLAIYFLVALMWLIPDTRIEKTLGR
jgi:Predicted integral membrane protein